VSTCIQTVLLARPVRKLPVLRGSVGFRACAIYLIIFNVGLIIPAIFKSWDLINYPGGIAQSLTSFSIMYRIRATMILAQLFIPVRSRKRAGTVGMKVSNLRQCGSSCDVWRKRLQCARRCGCCFTMKKNIDAKDNGHNDENQNQAGPQTAVTIRRQEKLMNNRRWIFPSHTTIGWSFLGWTGLIHLVPLVYIWQSRVEYDYPMSFIRCIFDLVAMASLFILFYCREVEFRIPLFATFCGASFGRFLYLGTFIIAGGLTIVATALDNYWANWAEVLSSLSSILEIFIQTVVLMILYSNDTVKFTSRLALLSASFVCCFNLTWLFYDFMDEWKPSTLDQLNWLRNIFSTFYIYFRLHGFLFLAHITLPNQFACGAAPS
jgi:hypothetical protein